MSSTASVHSSDLAFAYVETDIPAGMTVAQWRRARHEADRPERRERRRLRLGLGFGPRVRFA